MLSDEQIETISHTIDNFMVEQVIDHEIPPINLAGIMLARMIRMNQDSETEEELYKLFRSVLNKDHLQSRDLH
jgi:hypothetical protein